MIERIDNKIYKKNNFQLHILIAVLLHGIIFAGLIYGGLVLSKEINPIDGNNSIKAVMVDLSIMAAPEQSLVEDSPLIEEKQDDPIIENEKPEIQPEPVKEPEPVPDIIVENEIKKVEVPEPQLVITNKPIKRKNREKKKEPVKKASQPQVKQEINTEQRAEVAVAPSISSNNNVYSAIASPISRNQPIYPRRALDMRIEGYVIVKYDITSEGRVENIRIIETKPNNIFNRAVIQAMKQWKYQPISSKDLTIKIVFSRNKSIKLESS